MALPQPAAVPVVGGRLVSRQGLRPDRRNYHQGTDWSEHSDLPGQTVVRVIGPGTVEKVSRNGENSGYGNVVVVRHGSDALSVYAHLEQVFVGQGQVLVAGQPIGIVGGTFGTPDDPERRVVPHLHLEIVRDWPLSARNADARYDVLHELAAAGIVLGGPDGRELVVGEPIDYREPALVADAGEKGPGPDDEVVVAPPEFVARPRSSGPRWGLAIVAGAAAFTVVLLVATLRQGRKQK